MKKGGFDSMLWSLLASVAVANLRNLPGPQFPHREG